MADDHHDLNRFDIRMDQLALSARLYGATWHSIQAVELSLKDTMTIRRITVEQAIEFFSRRVISATDVCTNP
jgi:hypothetical protein